MNKKVLNSIYPQKVPDFIKAKLDHPAIAKQFLANAIELDDATQLNGLIDPIGDLDYAKGGQLIHRYQNRLLFAPTTVCPVNCRYCFRKNELNQSLVAFKSSLKVTESYLLDHPEIDEVIFTGGDPLILSDSKIEKYLKLFASFDHIKYIRFHTRTPIVDPMRLSSQFNQTIKKFNQRFIIKLVLHINHAIEWSDELTLHLKAFKSVTNCEVMSQSVLLKGVNDSVKDLVELYQLLANNQVRAYYLHHPDRVKGAMHFYLPIESGRKLYAQLREKLSGWMIPQYVLDMPDGAGKTPIYNPEQITFSGNLIDRKLNTIDHPLVN
jgi:lysine 2,3-aminomutase